MTDTVDTAAYRTRLEERLDALLARTGAVQEHLRGGDGRNELDFADRVSLTENDDVLEALDDSGRTELAAIRAALQRLDDGTYGTCAVCGEPIGAGRLDAVPWTPFCRDHA